MNGRGLTSATIAAALLALATAGCRTAPVTRTVVDVDPAELGAAPPAGGYPVLTPDLAVARALQHSAHLEAMRLEVKAAALRTRADNAGRDPEFRGTYGEGTLDETSHPFPVQGGPPQAPPLYAEPDVFESGDESGYRLALRMYPRHPLEQYWRRREGVAGERAAAEQLREAEWVLASEVRALFAAARYYERDLVLARQQAELLQEGDRRLAEIASQGFATAADAANAAFRALDGKAEVDVVEGRHAVARRRLAALVGIPLEHLQLADVETGPKDTVAAAMHDLEALAFARRPDLAAEYWTARALQLAASAVKSRRVPWLSYLQGSYGRGDRTVDQSTGDLLVGLETSTAERNAEEWRVDAGVVLPFFSLVGAEGPYAAAEAAAAAKRESALRQAIGLEVAEALEACRAAERQARRYRQAGEPVRAMLRNVIADLEAQPGADAAALVRAREQAVRIDRAMLQYDYEHRAALLRLQMAIGPEPDDGR